MVESNIDVIFKISKFSNNLSNILKSISEKTKNLSYLETERFIKTELSTNETFLEMRNEKSLICERINVVCEEFDNLEKIFERNDIQIKINSNCSLKNNTQDTEVVDLNIINSKNLNNNSISINKSNETNKSNKTPLVKKTITVDFSKDPDAQSINNNSEYQLINYISKGNFGKVYKAVSKVDNKEYALKTIPIDGNLPAKYLAIEQKAHITLNNLKENIIYYYGQIDLEANLRCLILELADDSLDNFIKTNYSTGMPEQIAFFFLEQIFKGIKYIHSKRIIHRDIKPANVLIKEFKVKICDFNVCRFIDDPDPKFTCVATPGYAAPEVMRSNTDFQKEDWGKVDVYSLGILLYFMLYGKLPYEFTRNLTIGKNWENAVKNINFTHADHQISDVAIDFIRKCLSVKIEDRPNLEELKTTSWFKKVGSEFNLVVKNNKILNHKHLYEILKSKY